MPPPYESSANFLEQNATDPAINGCTELNVGITYFRDETGRYYYRSSSDSQNLASLPADREQKNSREDILKNDQQLIEGSSYQTFTLMSTDNLGNEISYALGMQDETEPVLNINVQVDKIEEKGSDELKKKMSENIDEEGNNNKNNAIKVVSRQIGYVRPHFACNFCSYTNHKRYLLLRHMRRHSAERPHKCTVCDRDFKTAAALQNHLNMHKGIKPHVCEHCDTSFITSGELVRHIRYRHTHEKPHKCTECDYASVELSKLKRHVRSHTGEKPYQCSHCTYASQDKFRLKRHMRVHTGETPFKCELCDMSFAQIYSLRTHKLYHSIKPKFRCNLCPTKCGRKKAVRTPAQKQHTSEKEHACNGCGKSFPDRFPCKIHNKTHVGEKCFRCELCPYATTTLIKLQSHMNKHTNEKPFVCDQCNQYFGQKLLLLRHINLYHSANCEPASEEKWHACNDCGRKFTRKGNLIRHISIHDPVSDRQEGALKSGGETNMKLGDENVSIDDSDKTEGMIKLNLENDQVEGSELLTVVDDNGQQYVVLEVIQIENATDQQIDIIAPEEYLKKSEEGKEYINEVQTSEAIESKNVQRTAQVEKEIDTCYGMGEDDEPDENEILSYIDEIIFGSSDS